MVPGCWALAATQALHGGGSHTPQPSAEHARHEPAARLEGAGRATRPPAVSASSRGASLKLGTTGGPAARLLDGSLESQLGSGWLISAAELAQGATLICTLWPSLNYCPVQSRCISFAAALACEAFAVASLKLQSKYGCAYCTFLTRPVYQASVLLVTLTTNSGHKQLQPPMPFSESRAP